MAHSSARNRFLSAGAIKQVNSAKFAALDARDWAGRQAQRPGEWTISADAVSAD